MNISARFTLATVLSTSIALPSPALARAVAVGQPAAGQPTTDPAAGATGTQPTAGPAEGTDPTAGMTEEEMMARAKELYAEGEAAVAEENYPTAVEKFEQAYHTFAPSLHVFNFNIGNAAYYAGDCIKAKAAFQRFLDLVPDHPERGTAQEMLLEIERSGCAEQQQQQAQAQAQPEPEPEPQQQRAVPTAADQEDAPILESSRAQRERAIQHEAAKDVADRASGLMITGAVFTGLGVAAGVGGGVTLALANRKSKDLQEAAEPGPLGFPEGDYSEQELYDLDRNELPAYNWATVGLFVGGGVVLAAGVSMLIADAVIRKKRREAAAARRSKRFELVGIGPSVHRDGAGMAATLRF